MDTLSRYRLAYIIGFVVMLIVITIIGKKCQNTPFLLDSNTVSKCLRKWWGIGVCELYVWNQHSLRPLRGYILFENILHTKRNIHISYHPSFLSSSPMQNLRWNLSYPPLQNWSYPPFHWLYQSNVRLRCIYIKKTHSKIALCRLQRKGLYTDIY